jgi:hypothetical protein
MSNFQDRITQAQNLFSAGNFSSCLELLLPIESSSAEAAALAQETRRQMAELKTQEELEIHLENVKKEAMDLFDREEYSASLEKFTYLSGQLPDDRMILDYLKLCREMTAEPDKSPGARVDTPEEPCQISFSFPPDPIESLTNTPEESPAMKASANPVTGEIPGEVEPLNDGPSPDGENPDEPVPAPPKPMISILVGFLLVVLMIAALWYLFAWDQTPSSLEVYSEPDGAAIWLDGAMKGQTPLRLSPVPAGNYTLRVQKDGFLTYTQQIMISKRQPTTLSVKLAKMPDAHFDAEEFLSTAQVLFSQGRWLEAQEYCDRILVKDPKHQGAKELSGKIYDQMHPPTPDEIGPVVPTVSSEPSGATGMEKKEGGASSAPILPTPHPPSTSSPAPAAPQRLDNQPIAVIHHHFVGSCRGKLVIHSNEISFVPDDSSNEGFFRNISDIEKIEVGNNLKIQFKNKLFRFDLADAPNDPGNREKLIQISRQIMEKMAQNNR